MNENNNEPIFSVLSGKYPNGFVATGIPSDWNQIQSTDPNNETYNYCGGDSWCGNEYIYYDFRYLTDWPCACDDNSTLISGWFFFGGYGPSAFVSGSSSGPPPSGGWQTWNNTANCVDNNVSACGGGSQTINLTFTPV